MKDLAYAFTICFATLGPLKTIPVFFLATHGADRRTILTMAARSTILATLIVLLITSVKTPARASFRIRISTSSPPRSTC